MTRTASNGLYKWATPTPGTTANAYDGLDRDSAIVTAGGYDLRGNLTADGSRTLTYDVENRMLTAVSGGATVTFAYDPIGRLTTTTTPASTTFLYDSDRLSAEYNGSGTLLRRYVFGPAVDEPLVWYEGSGTTDRRWLHQDRLGSIIGYSDSAGTVTASTVYKYGPWGEPGDAWGAGSRFRYTGQIAIPEVKLYYYKARMYDPATGRFMQSDPIGYKDDLNLYAYVGGDPVGRTDPTGTEVSSWYYPAQRLLVVRDMDTGRMAVAEAFSGSSGGGPVEAGTYAILNQAQNDHYFRLERRDSNYGDDATPSGRGLFRLHKGTRSNGCITMCNPPEGDTVMAIIRGTFTHPDRVDSKSSVPFSPDQEDATNYGTLYVDPEGVSFSIDPKTRTLSVTITKTVDGKEVGETTVLCVVKSDENCKK